MDFRQEAAKLTEKFYTLKGSNQANEIQTLLEEALGKAYQMGQRFTTGAKDAKNATAI